MDGHQRLKRASIMFTFVVLHLVQAQDQQGFISLDCGLEPNQSPYLEPATNLSFSSDHDFIQTGKRGKIAKGLSYEYKQYNALRYFPEGKRHCYNLSVKQDISYLIRAGFAYGNYDGKNIYPSFDIYIGPNWWATVYDDRKDFEIIHMAKSNSLQICLVQTGPTTPFISTLELRPLRNDSYSTQSGSLQLVYRHFYISNLDVRYPDDVYDRLWYSNSWFGNDAEINTTHTVNSSNAFVVPQVIARSAAISGNASEPLYFFESTDNPSDNIIIYLHFAEIQDLQANDTREFDIVWNENITNSAYTPKKLEIDTIFNTSPGKCDDQTCYMQLVRTRKSTLPPLLNAYEVYKVMELPHSETHPGDGESDGVALDWESRLRIVIETAQGLEYLHNGCQPPMIHRDVKTTNILLDEHLQAKLADFGLSRSFPIGVESHVSTNVAGTPGYLDPEYYRTNWLTEKSDVYSLGIVLLEMITDRPVIQQTREKPHIGEWVGLMLTKGDIESIMDPNLKGEYDSSSVWKALELAMSCVNPSSAGRPNMSQVVSELKECLIYENSRKEGRSDMDSKSSLELSTSFTAEVTPDAR
ncbi:unnamed protein product [Microthlaspi erraticum]|uniref:Protein kinase domain-containing protein n=1 Tax=Microthlaspi erraticum TaxID=1685480 RepID=A0A6D2HQ70_9BRAS|nr:unnamed protein product [Microthlaspi erraticum]